jgi:hypothetical protein
MSEQNHSIVPLVLANAGKGKPLPLAPESILVSVLKMENRMLLTENEALCRDVEVYKEQICRYRRIITAAKILLRQRTLSAQQFENELQAIQGEEDTCWENYSAETKDSWV